nr:hypothetical protein [Microcystis aeruginosa]
MARAVTPPTRNSFGSPTGNSSPRYGSSRTPGRKTLNRQKKPQDLRELQFQNCSVKSWKTIGFFAVKPGKLAESLPL